MSQHKREEVKVAIEVLLNDGTVSAITSDVYPDLAPDDASSAFVVVSRVVGIESKTKTAEPTKTTRMQVDCYASTKEQVNDLADACESALKGYSGTTYGAIDVVSILHESDNPSEYDEDNERYRTSDDYNVKVKV